MDSKNNRNIITKYLVPIIIAFVVNLLFFFFWNDRLNLNTDLMKAEHDYHVDCRDNSSQDSNGEVYYDEMMTFVFPLVSYLFALPVSLTIAGITYLFYKLIKKEDKYPTRLFIGVISFILLSAPMAIIFKIYVLNMKPYWYKTAIEYCRETYWEFDF